VLVCLRFVYLLPPFWRFREQNTCSIINELQGMEKTNWMPDFLLARDIFFLDSCRYFVLSAPMPSFMWFIFYLLLF
jgi:hypothetical protein